MIARGSESSPHTPCAGPPHTACAGYFRRPGPRVRRKRATCPSYRETRASRREAQAVVTTSLVPSPHRLALVSACAGQLAPGPSHHSSTVYPSTRPLNSAGGLVIENDGCGPGLPGMLRPTPGPCGLWNCARTHAVAGGGGPPNPGGVVGD